MLYIELDRMKKHLNIEDSFKDDDVYISQLIEVAQNIVELHINTPLSSISEEGVLPPALQQCIMFLVSDYYANRESVSFASAQEIPYTYQYLIGLFRNYSDASRTT